MEHGLWGLQHMSSAELEVTVQSRLRDLIVETCLSTNLGRPGQAKRYVGRRSIKGLNPRRLDIDPERSNSISHQPKVSKRSR